MGALPSQRARVAAKTELGASNSDETTLPALKFADLLRPHAGIGPIGPVLRLAPEEVTRSLPPVTPLKLRPSTWRANRLISAGLRQIRASSRRSPISRCVRMIDLRRSLDSFWRLKRIRSFSADARRAILPRIESPISAAQRALRRPSRLRRPVPIPAGTTEICASCCWSENYWRLISQWSEWKRRHPDATLGRPTLPSALEASLDGLPPCSLGTCRAYPWARNQPPKLGGLWRNRTLLLK